MKKEFVEGDRITLAPTESQSDESTHADYAVLEVSPHGICTLQKLVDDSVLTIIMNENLLYIGGRYSIVVKVASGACRKYATGYKLARARCEGIAEVA